jgi:hypothetical protein
MSDEGILNINYVLKKIKYSKFYRLELEIKIPKELK